LISDVNLTGKQVSIRIEAQYAVLVELPTKVRVFSKFDRYNEYSSHALHRVNKCIISAHYASKKITEDILATVVTFISRCFISAGHYFLGAKTNSPMHDKHGNFNKTCIMHASILVLLLRLTK
jgi:hypothetical protein